MTFDSCKRPWRRRVLLVIALMLWVVATGGGWFMQAGLASERGLLLASTVYQQPGAGVSMVRVMQSGKLHRRAYEVLINDLLSHKLLEQPQLIELGPEAVQSSASLQRFSDGSIFLILSGQQVWRLNPQQRQFEPFTGQLKTRYPQQLGRGVKALDFAGPQWPDAFVLSNSEGERYELHWVSQQIYPEGGSMAAFETHDFSLTPNAYVDLAELSGAPVQQGNAPVMAVLSYGQKPGPGGLQYRPRLQLQYLPPVMEQVAPELVKAQTRSFRFENMLWTISRLALARWAIEDFTALAPRMPRYNGRVLARNSERLLMVYELGHEQHNAKVLEMISTRTAISVWRQTVSKIKPLVGNESALSAQPYEGGFYLRSDNERPAMLMDNEGKLVHDFTTTELL